jgi:hypothetical protein
LRPFKKVSLFVFFTLVRLFGLRENGSLFKIEREKRRKEKFLLAKAHCIHLTSPPFVVLKIKALFPFAEGPSFEVW